MLGPREARNAPITELLQVNIILFQFFLCEDLMFTTTRIKVGICFRSVAQLCPNSLCDPMDCSKPASLTTTNSPEFTQIL